MKNLFLFVALWGSVFSSSAQITKRVEAINIQVPLIIDGDLNEAIYEHAEPAKDFVQIQPLNGKPSFQPSEVYLFYDQSAIYVGAKLYDSSPDSIFNYLTRRDNIGMSDYFGIYLDPYHKGLLAYGFFVTPAGVQTDMKAIKGEYDEEDDHWNAVWQSKTRLTDEGWMVEMKIPYSALRFPNTEVQTWGVNMFRNIRRYNSNNSWNFIDREVAGFIHQEGELVGIKDIKPPVRLSLSPYVASYFESKRNEKSSELIYKGGMDLKYGINESFTLDMMLIPDFGQIQSDDKELNLSPYELYYDEKRQFFNEGTELFQRGNVFYSRRIGSTPKFAGDVDGVLVANEVVNYNPSTTRLVNASKISGRMSNGWGLGMLHAMTLPANAIILDTITGHKRNYLVQPFTSYNTMVVDKSMKNNSYISLINTNMTMLDKIYGANVTATEFQLRDKNKRYSLKGKGGFSYRRDDNQVKEVGGYAKLEMAKNGGKLNYGIGQEVYSKDFNPNDMGYLKQNNLLITNPFIEYHIVKPFWILREWHNGTWAQYKRIIEPNDVIDTEVGVWTYLQFKNNYNLDVDCGGRTARHDYYETRVDGRYYQSTFYYWTNIGLSTDRRKNISFYSRIGANNHTSSNEHSYWIELEMYARIGQRFRFEYDFLYKNRLNNVGYVSRSDDDTSIYFATRDVDILENAIEFDYTFTNAISLAFRGRHYWSGVKNANYSLLQLDGSLKDAPAYSDNHDNNLNFFNIDMIVRWDFAPGSEISLAWKNAIYNEKDRVNYSYRDNFINTLSDSKTNTISLKMLYYIDYHTVKSIRKSKVHRARFTKSTNQLYVER